MIIDDLTKQINLFLEETFAHNKARLKHINNVIAIALELGEIFSCNKEAITIAALLHDSTKQLNYQENLLLASTMFSESELLGIPEPCLHSYSAGALAKVKFGVEDQDILNAIIYHCSGRPQMSDLEMIIFISDYIEESRVFVSDDLKQLARLDLRQTTYMIMKETIEYLKSENKQISNLTLLAIQGFEENHYGGNE